jgi:hypothetical protein
MLQLTGNLEGGRSFLDEMTVLITLRLLPARRIAQVPPVSHVRWMVDLQHPMSVHGKALGPTASPPAIYGIARHDQSVYPKAEFP